MWNKDLGWDMMKLKLIPSEIQSPKIQDRLSHGLHFTTCPVEMRPELCASLDR